MRVRREPRLIKLQGCGLFYLFKAADYFYFIFIFI